MELLVVIGIIAILISLLLPALAKAREQARYTRWQAFGRDMSMDPNMVLYWNFQNDRGGNSITNMAVSNQDNTSFVPSDLNGTVADTYLNPRAPMTPTTQGGLLGGLTYLWANDGRFRGKPALTFGPLSGASGCTCVYPSSPNRTGVMANLLKKSQAITIMMWIYLPSNALVQNLYLPTAWSQNGGGATGPFAFQISNPGSAAGVGWACAGDQAPNHPGFNYGSDGKWTLWCFTKDANAGTMKMYQNGVLFASGAGFKSKFSSFDLADPFNSNDLNTFHLGQQPSQGNWTGSIDELAIFNADLSPQDVDPTSGAVINAPAVRFLQMYQMGVN